MQLCATETARNIISLDPKKLRGRGITLLLADLDNTLAPYGATAPDAALLNFKDSLHTHGITLFVLSNCRKPRRVATFCSLLNAPFLARAGKPRTAGFLRAMERCGKNPSETLMAGDQVFTDVWGARRAGLPVVLVSPISLRGNPMRYLRCAAEWPFRLLAEKRKKVFS